MRSAASRTIASTARGDSSTTPARRSALPGPLGGGQTPERLWPTLGPRMAWNTKPHNPAFDAEHTMNDYQAGLRAAELRARLESDTDRGLPDRHFNRERLRNVASLWTLAVLLIAGAATWLLDTVLAVEIVAVFTAIAIVATFARWRRPPDRDAP